MHYEVRHLGSKESVSDPLCDILGKLFINGECIGDGDSSPFGKGWEGAT